MGRGNDCSTIAKANKELIAKSKDGNRTAVDFLLKHCNGTDINSKDRFGSTSLIWASKNGHLQVVKLLLREEGIDINKYNNYGETALYLASYYGNGEIVKQLLNEPEIDLNRLYSDRLRDILQKTVLWIASEKKHNDIVQILLEHSKTDVTKGISANESVILKVGTLIFRDVNAEEEETREILVAALLGNDTKISELLQSKGIDVNSLDSSCKTPLFWASTRGHTSVVKLLLGEGNVLVNVGRSSDGANTLYQASRYGFLNIVSILLEHPMVDVNYATLDKKTSLMIASTHGHSKVVKKLLSMINIDVNYATFDGMTALIYAVLAKQPIVLELLLRCPKINTNLQDEEYMTALERANEMNYHDLTSLFKARGYLQITKGHTCCSKTIDRGLNLAVENGVLTWIKTFIVCPGININVHNKDGYPPLNLAIQRGLIEMVVIFLSDQRIDVNMQNTGDKQNAILIASEGQHVDIMKLLLLHNQTLVNQQNSKGQSALSVALHKYSEWPHPFESYLIIKLMVMCPKTEFTNETLAQDTKDTAIWGDIQLVIGFPAVIMPTCCLNINESILGAAWTGDFRAIRGLLECPEPETNINVVDKKGRTPLYIASMMGHIQAVKVLLQNPNEDVNIGQIIDGGTAFSIASEKAYFDVMRVLIEDGESDENKGWCSGKWANPCEKMVLSHSGTKMPATSISRTDEDCEIKISSSV